MYQLLRQNISPPNMSPAKMYQSFSKQHLPDQKAIIYLHVIIHEKQQRNVNVTALKETRLE